MDRTKILFISEKDEMGNYTIIGITSQNSDILREYERFAEESGKEIRKDRLYF